MKNLMLFVHPSKDFIREHKTSVKIEIDNNLSLGWKVSDIILATNFPFEYRGVKSILVSDDNYNAEISPCAPIINVIVELFRRKLIEKNELYWYHDSDLYQLHDITESEINLGTSDIGLIEWPNGQKISASSIFFKESAKDIFGRIKEIMYKDQVDEEVAISMLYENVQKRVKKINITYDFEIGYLNQHYPLSSKPIKTAHFHYTRDHLLDSALYGKNRLNKVILPERLIKIFHQHGVKGIFPKPMKNLVVYFQRKEPAHFRRKELAHFRRKELAHFRRKELAHINPEKKFLGETEDLVKRQIDNSFKLGWKKEDIILITNFPYKYQGVKSTVLDESLFSNINYKATASNAIFQLLNQEVVKEVELWWYHDLDVFQLRKIDSSEIDLDDTAAGFMDDGSGKFDTGSFFFRKYSDKIFEWMRNRTCKLNTDETAAFASLVSENFHHINSKFVKLDLANNFSKRIE